MDSNLLDNWVSQITGGLSRIADSLERHETIAESRSASRLSPPPAPAAEPCMVVEYGDGTFSIQTPDRKMYWHPDLGWDFGPTGFGGCHKSRASAELALPAARAALAAEKGQPAPASTPAFDPVAEAKRLLLAVDEFCTVVPGKGLLTVAIGYNAAIPTAAAALTAAHAAGRAEGDAAGYARGREERAGFKDAEFETVIAEVKRSRDALAAELAEARKAGERQAQATDNLIRCAIEVADFIEGEYADGNDDGDIIPVSSPAHKIHSHLWGAIFKVDLPNGAGILAARLDELPDKEKV